MPHETFPLGPTDQQVGRQAIGLLGQLGQQRTGDDARADNDAKALLKRCCEVEKLLPCGVQNLLLHVGRCCPHELPQPLQRCEIGNVQQIERHRCVFADLSRAFNSMACRRGQIGCRQDAIQWIHGALLGSFAHWVPVTEHEGL